MAGTLASGEAQHNARSAPRVPCRYNYMTDKYSPFTTWLVVYVPLTCLILWDKL